LHILVSGGGGYIGGRLVDYFLSMGFAVTILSRFPPKSKNISWIEYNFFSFNKIKLPKDVDVIIHLASLGKNTVESGLEESAAAMLIRSAKALGAKFLFISSQTARSSAPTAYGRVKWRIEQLVLDSGGIVVRPGQVFGGVLTGPFKELVDFVDDNFFLPIIFPAVNIQPVHIDDLIVAISAIVTRRYTGPRVFCVAADKPQAFSEFLKLIAKHRLHKTRLFVPIPKLVLVFFLKSRFIRNDRLVSLLNLPIMGTESDLRELNLEPRSVELSMHPTGNGVNRLLVLESIAFYKYIMMAPPPQNFIKNYLRAIKKIRGGVNLKLSPIFYNFPVLLSLFEKRIRRNAWEKELQTRMHIAIFIAEASVEGANKFIGNLKGHKNYYISLLIFRVMIREIFWFIATVFFIIFRLLILKFKTDR
jgi:nucleoside-diphosphate-sugar epimerase